jgi:hypothetical protein
LELTSFEYPLDSIRPRRSPKPLPRIYIKKESLEHEKEESFAELCCSNTNELLLFRATTIRLFSLIKKFGRRPRMG